jgi:hypothetical protein
MSFHVFRFHRDTYSESYGSIYGLSYGCQYYSTRVVIISSALLNIHFMKLGIKTMPLEISKIIRNSSCANF